MKIGKINSNNMRNDEHFQFHTEFRDLIQKETPQKLKILDQYNAYLPLYQREDEALNTIKKSSLTAQILQADKARDRAFSGISKTAKAALNHYNPQVREAARRLKILFDTYGNISKKPVNEQTSATYNLLQELQGSYAQAAEAANIKQWSEELQTLNNTLSDLMRRRVDEAASKTVIVLKTARSELDQSYAAICERINALALVEGESEYESFIKKLNVVIAKYAMALSVRAGKRRRGEELLP